MKNKLLVITLTLVVAIALVGAIAASVLLKYTAKASGEPTIEEVVEASVDVLDITTNLASDDFIKMSFKIQTESVEAKEELEKRDFQVKNLIIQELSEKKGEDIQSKKGKIELENSLKSQINNLMQEGKIVKVYITDSLLQ